MKQPSYIQPSEVKKQSVDQDDDDFERDVNDTLGFQSKKEQPTEKESLLQQVVELENDLENVEEDDEQKQ
jgi:hypothetical protein